MKSAASPPHRHRWKPNTSVAVAGSFGFSGPLLDRIKRETNIRLIHPGYRLDVCSCGKYRLTDYCGPAFGRGIITAEQKEKARL